MKPDTKLSEVIAPAFADCNEEQIGDALLWWGQLSGQEREWTRPSAPVTFDQERMSELRTAAQGLGAVTDLLRILSEGQVSKTRPRIESGLIAAACALSWKLECDLIGGGD